MWNAPITCKGIIIRDKMRFCNASGIVSQCLVCKNTVGMCITEEQDEDFYGSETLFGHRNECTYSPKLVHGSDNRSGPIEHSA